MITQQIAVCLPYVAVVLGFAFLAITARSGWLERFLRPAAAPARRGTRAWRWLTLGRTERHARRALGLPAGHPERVAAELPWRDEAWLECLADALWPDGEYASIVREFGEGM